MGHLHWRKVLQALRSKYQFFLFGEEPCCMASFITMLRITHW